MNKYTKLFTALVIVSMFSASSVFASHGHSTHYDKYLLYSPFLGKLFRLSICLF